MAPFVLTAVTYTTRYMKKTDLYTCWFEPSTYDWILHGPNVILQIVSLQRPINYIRYYVICPFIFSLILLYLFTYVSYSHENLTKLIEQQLFLIKGVLLNIGKLYGLHRK